MKQILKYITFTRNELKVIIFISIILTTGFCIKYVKNYLSGTNQSQYDYSDSDKKFLSYSRNALNTIVKDSFYYKNVSNESDSDLIRNLQNIDDSVQLNSESQQLKGKKEKFLKDKFININTAGKEDLIKLPGVGDAMAEKIIYYRETHNGFRKIEDIKKIKGIGKKKFEKLKPYITIE
jgi:competence protein ComEA